MGLVSSLTRIDRYLAIMSPPCGLAARDRLRPGNILPPVLGPHGSDFADVAKGLGTLTDLDGGIVMAINGVKTRICAWTMMFIGDMPQQAENSGFKSPRAHKFCRACYISAGNKSVGDLSSNVTFDSVTNGRYHHQVRQMQRTMSSLQGAKKDAYGSQWGMQSPSSTSNHCPCVGYYTDSAV